MKVKVFLSVIANKIYVKSGNTWHYALTEKMTVQFQTISKTEIRVTTKRYCDGTLANTVIKDYHAVHSASYNANMNEPALVSHLKEVMA
jgi:hypothetical protein